MEAKANGNQKENPVHDKKSNFLQSYWKEQRLRICSRCSSFDTTKRRIYMYDTSTRSMNRRPSNTIPSRVSWILARFHPRHVWCGRALPKVQEFTTSLNAFANRIRQKCYLRETEKSNLSACVPRNTSHCTHPVSPVLEHWLSSLIFSLSHLFKKCHRVASTDRSFSNKIPFVDFCFRIMASSNVEVVANDKDGRSCLVDPEVLSMIHLQLLENSQHFESDWSNWDTTRVESLEGAEVLLRSLCESLYMPRLHTWSHHAKATNSPGL